MLDVLATTMTRLILVLLLLIALLLSGSIKSDRVLDSDCGLCDLLTRCSQPSGRFKLLKSEFSGCLLARDGFVLLPCLLLAFEVLKKVVKLFLRRKLFLLLLLVFFYSKQ